MIARDASGRRRLIVARGQGPVRSGGLATPRLLRAAVDPHLPLGPARFDLDAAIAFDRRPARRFLPAKRRRLRVGVILGRVGIRGRSRGRPVRGSERGRRAVTRAIAGGRRGIRRVPGGRGERRARDWCRALIGQRIRRRGIDGGGRLIGARGKRGTGRSRERDGKEFPQDSLPPGLLSSSQGSSLGPKELPKGHEEGPFGRRFASCFETRGRAALLSMRDSLRVIRAWGRSRTGACRHEMRPVVQTA